MVRRRSATGRELRCIFAHRLAGSGTRVAVPNPSRFAPLEPERCVRHFFGVGTPGEVSEAERARDHRASDFVGPEDIRLCEAVQRGLRQRGYNQGRYVIDATRNEWSEHALHHFHRQYLEHMTARSGNP